jgi:hypothetical protein
MNDLDKSIFTALFREACLKGFGFPLTSFLSEADSKLLSNKIFESTGLIIGPKSIKNYSFFVISSKKDQVHEENPSVSTLDTLARYVLDAPYTNEIRRKDTESHYPYWFEYRSRFSDKLPAGNTFKGTLKTIMWIIFGISAVVLCFLMINHLTLKNRSGIFTDNFNSVSGDSLKRNGWMIIGKDPGSSYSLHSER